MEHLPQKHISCWSCQLVHTIRETRTCPRCGSNDEKPFAQRGRWKGRAFLVTAIVVPLSIVVIKSAGTPSTPPKAASAPAGTVTYAVPDSFEVKFPAAPHIAEWLIPVSTPQGMREEIAVPVARLTLSEGGWIEVVYLQDGEMLRWAPQYRTAMVNRLLRKFHAFGKQNYTKNMESTPHLRLVISMSDSNGRRRKAIVYQLVDTLMILSADYSTAELSAVTEVIESVRLNQPTAAFAL